MFGYVVRRLLWMVPTLFGITLLTFVVLEIGPLDRAEIAVAREFESADAERRVEAVHRLRVRYGMLDAEGRPRSLWARYTAWLSHVARFDFASEGENEAAFRERFVRAVTITMLIGSLAIGLALVGGVVFGTWLGMRAGSTWDRIGGNAVLVGYALPEFLTVTLLLLMFGGGWFDAYLPTHGLRDPSSAGWSWGARCADLCAHLAMPVAALTIVPLANVTRYVREATVTALRSDFVAAMRNWGADERQVRRAVRRHGMRPAATLIGTLLPLVVTGSVVVEQTFGIPGVGRLAYEAVLSKSVGVVMAVTVVVSVVALVALLLSDLAHRHLDPRVQLR